jgi:katanin p60 ATPase-containing subunit A1
MMGMRRKIKGLSAEQIRQLNKEAVDEPLSMMDFEEAILKISSSVSKKDLEKYEEWMKVYGIFYFVYFRECIANSFIHWTD